MMKNFCKEQGKLPGAGAHSTGAVTPPLSTPFVGWRSLRLPRAAAYGLIVASLAAMSAPLAAQAQDAADIGARNHHGQWRVAEATEAGLKAPASAGDRVRSDPGQGRYGGAILLLRQKLETRERTLGKEHPFTLTTINSLALLYKAQGSYSEAEPLYNRALEASERTLGRDHPFTLATVNSLASLYKDQGRYGEAEQLHRRTVAARGRTPGN